MTSSTSMSRERCFILRFGKDSLRLMIIIPDEQGYARECYDKFKGYDKDILHSDNGFIS